MNTIAGQATKIGYSGDNGDALLALLNFPTCVCADINGNIYISDRSNHVIRMISIKTNIITTIAGTGSWGYSGDNNLATMAKLHYPFAVIIDSMKYIYITDSSNHVIRKITIDTDIITTIAGNNSIGYAGDGTNATLSQLNYPTGIDIDINGNIYISDRSNHVIRKILIKTNIITTIAGIAMSPGYKAYKTHNAAKQSKLSSPNGISIDISGNIYIADTDNFLIRKIVTSYENIKIDDKDDDKNKFNNNNNLENLDNLNLNQKLKTLQSKSFNSNVISKLDDLFASNTDTYSKFNMLGILSIYLSIYVIIISYLLKYLFIYFYFRYTNT
jgi:sugar lactone lactonase YvrE